jgi:hypothetical protein
MLSDVVKRRDDDYRDSVLLITPATWRSCCSASRCAVLSMICGGWPDRAQLAHSVRQNAAPSTVTTTTARPGAALPQLSQRWPRGHRSVGSVMTWRVGEHQEKREIHAIDEKTANNVPCEESAN